MLVVSFPCCLFFGTRLSSIRAGDQLLMRVLLQIGGDDEKPRLVLVPLVVSRLYMSFGGLDGPLGGEYQSALLIKIVLPRHVQSVKACARSALWLQADLWAEVFPADTRYRRVERSSLCDYR